MSRPRFLGMLARARAAVALLALAAAGFAAAGDAAAGGPAGTKLDVGAGGKCVADPQFMRRNHMDMLKHHRDEAVHLGVRTSQYSLANCVSCHASRKNNSVLGSSENFCQGCHEYVAVKLDCFECHASKPKGAEVAAAKTSANGAAK